MNKILITGGAGFIGYHLAKHLAVNNRVVILDNLSRGRMDHDFIMLLDDPNITFINVDLTDPAIYADLDTGFDYIYHLAAVIGVKNVAENPDRVLYVNALTNLYLFEFAKRIGNLKRIFFSSTSEIYAGTLKHFGIEIPTSESVQLTLDDIASPRTTYMLSKMFGEAICFNYNFKYGIPFTIGRYHNVYGPRMGFLHVVPEMFCKIKNDSSIGVASPDHTRAMCYIGDAVEMTILACESGQTLKEILNIGNQDQEIKMIELAEIIAEVMGRDVSLLRLPETAGSPARRCPDIAKIRRLTGYSPKTGLTEGIRLTYNWYKDKLDQKYE